MEQTQNPPGRRCSKCGTAILVETTGGLCPRCLLEMNLASRTMPGGEPSPQIPPPSPGEIADRFPQFQIVECLGRGGMGVVYKARQKSLDRWVAIKLLAPERVHDERFAEHFEREAKTLARLSHPNIVTVFDHGEADGLFYIVMEFVDGVNLRDLLMEGKMEPAQALAIVPEICAALQFAHDHGVVHRDIKPENILIDRDGRVKIADFGIAALVGTDADPSGTPPYMAPEQEAAGGIIDHRADIYALGVVLYEMLTGVRPDHDPTRPSQRVEIDVRLDEIVLRALEKEPARRYQTAGEFRTVVQTMAANPSNIDWREESQAGQSPEDGRSPQTGSRLKWTEKQRRQMLWYGFTVSLIGLPAGLALNLPWVWGLSIAGILIAGMRLGLDRAFHRHLRKPIAASPHAEAASPNRTFVIVGRRGNRSTIHWPGVVLVFFIILVVVQTGGALFCLALGTPMDARALMIGFLSTVMAIGIGLARARTVPVERLVDLDKTATSKPDQAAGSPSPLKPRATPGIFRRFWWLLLGILALGPLIGAVTGLALILPKEQDVLHTVIAVFDVKGSEREVKAAVAQVTSPPTLDVISRQLDLTHEWNCETDEVARRLRQLILVEPVVQTNLIRVKVHQLRRSPQPEAARIADAIRAALVDQPDGPVISLMGREYEMPSKIESALPVAIGAVLGLVLSPLLAMLVMMSLHRLFPPPQPRWWAAGIAGVLVIALLVSLGFGIKFLHEIRTANLVHIPRGPVRSESLNTPEHAARSFMEAIRDGKIDAAMTWMDQSTDTWFDSDFEPGKKTGDRLRDSLQHLSDEMIGEAYAGEMDRLTQFTEWHPGDRDETTRFLAVGIAAPSRWHEGGPGHALYLILSSTPEGWRVAHVGQATDTKSLAKSMGQYLALRAGELPVTPPRTSQNGSSDSPEQVARSFMEAIRDGDMDAAMAWMLPEMKQMEKLPLHLELASKILRDEIYAGQLERLTRFAEKEFTNVDGTTMLFAVRVTPPAGDQAQEEAKHGVVLILSSTPDGWRVVHFGEDRAGKSLSDHVKRFWRMNFAIMDAWLAKPQAGPKQVDLLDVDAHQGPVVLDLASGELLSVPKEVKSQSDFTRHFTQLGKGDLAWDVGAIITLRGARLSEWLDNGWTLRNPERELEGSGGYRITVPARLRVTTAEGGHYVVDVREKIEPEKGVRIEVQRSETVETTNSTPEAKLPPEGAEIRRFVLELPVQPPLVVPKDSPLTIDQVKEVLKGVTWGKLLAALAEDGKGDGIAVREIPSPGEKNNRYEIAFSYATGQMLMDLTVDWRFRSAEPSRLRPAGMPDKVLTHSSEFLPQLAIRYAMLTGHEAATPAVEEAKAKVRQAHDRKTLQQYARALMLYQESMGSFPPDLATLLDGDYPGKKPWEELKKDGLMQNHQTGKMERPVYHGSKDLRDRDHDGSEYILVAAPSADRTGQRLVAFLDTSVKVIDEADYQKQMAKQAAEALLKIKLSITPESISLNGRIVSREELAEELKKWPPETPIQITAARTVDYKTISAIMGICRNANMKNITFVANPAGDTIAAVVESLAKKLSGIAAKYPELAAYKEVEANRGDSLFYSQNFEQPAEKRGIMDSDFGKNGCVISFSTAPIPPKDRAYAMTEPTLKLENLGLYLWAEIRTGANPSNGFQKEIQELLSSHAEMLKSVDSKKSANP